MQQLVLCIIRKLRGSYSNRRFRNSAMCFNLTVNLLNTVSFMILFTMPVISKCAKDKCDTTKYFNTITQDLKNLKVIHNASSESLAVRSFLINKNRHWLSAVVPYEIDPSYDSWERKKIGAALEVFHKTTCIRFVPRTKERDYVRYSRSASWCLSSLGRTGGRQDILLSDDCLHLPGYRGAVLHETMHSLGFIHEYQRTDRDCYVLVTGKGHDLQDFNYLPGTDTSFPYDVHSIMHYKQKPYLKGRNGKKVGNYLGTLSDLDVQKLNYVYCGKPHYCSLHPGECAATERATRHCRVHM